MRGQRTKKNKSQFRHPQLERLRRFPLSIKSSVTLVKKAGKEVHLGLGVLEAALKKGIFDEPFKTLPFMAALPVFIFLLGILSPLITPSRDFRLPGPTLDIPDDGLLTSFLLGIVPPADVDKNNDQDTYADSDSSRQIVPLKVQNYTFHSGDSLSVVANRYNVSLGTVISFNDIHNVRRIGAGSKLQIPNTDGISYIVRKGDSLTSIAHAYDMTFETILTANSLKSPVISMGQKIFLPGIALSSWELKQALGELFIYPVRGYISSRFGYRLDPFTGARTFHNGIDIANSLGTPVRASMDGRVSDMGFNSSYGNFIIINHDGGFQSMYGHLKAFKTSVGEYVNQGQIIGLMGSTGYSTGPHCHFSLFKWNRPLDPLNYLY